MDKKSNKENEKKRDSLSKNSLNSNINYYNIEESQDYEAISIRKTELINDMNYHIISSEKEFSSKKSKSVNVL